MQDISAADLPGLCAKWQKILRLQDWQVKVSFARHYDLPDNKAAYVIFSRPHRTANIQLLDPIDLDPAATFPEDQEISLVHELLHLHFAIFDEEFGSGMIRLEEIVLNALDQAFVALDRK